MLAVGLMSGTSLDAVDAALVEIVPRGAAYVLTLVRFAMHPFEPALRTALLEALPPNRGSVEAVARLHRRLGEAYARAAQAVSDGAAVDFVASHGQTMWHDGPAHVTLQLGDAFAIRDALRATVICDFRNADCAAGGQGAPLVARVDALLLADPNEDRVALNLGGIANVTLLRRGASPEKAVGFDTGPGNMLLDAFVAARTGGRLHCDRDGMLARSGSVDASLLGAMLTDAYFAAPFPKTSGRERFGRHFLERFQERLETLSLEAGAATLTELTAASIAQALRAAGFAPARVIASGGGAANPTLLQRIAARLEPAHVETSDAMGLPADAKEAMAFAVLGYETLRERPGNAPAATGAVRATLLGAIAPYNLRALLAKVERECA